MGNSSTRDKFKDVTPSYLYNRLESDHVSDYISVKHPFSRPDNYKLISHVNLTSSRLPQDLSEDFLEIANRKCVEYMLYHLEEGQDVVLELWKKTGYFNCDMNIYVAVFRS